MFLLTKGKISNVLTKFKEDFLGTLKKGLKFFGKRLGPLLITSLATAAVGIGVAIAGVGLLVSSFFASDKQKSKFTEVITKFWDKIKEPLTRTFTLVSDIALGLADKFFELFGTSASLVKDKLVDFFTNFSMSDLIDDMIEGVDKFLTGFVDFGTWLGESTAKLVIGAQDVGSTLSGIQDTASLWVTDLAVLISDTFSEVKAHFIQSFTWLGNKIKDWFTDLKSKITGLISNLNPFSSDKDVQGSSPADDTGSMWDNFSFNPFASDEVPRSVPPLTSMSTAAQGADAQATQTPEALPSAKDFTKAEDQSKLLMDLMATVARLSEKKETATPVVNSKPRPGLANTPAFVNDWGLTVLNSGDM